MWILQAKALMKVFDADLTLFVASLLRIKLPMHLSGPKQRYTEDLQVDFGFMDKVLTHMVGLDKSELR